MPPYSWENNITHVAKSLNPIQLWEVISYDVILLELPQWSVISYDALPLELPLSMRSRE